jgi:NADH-quinone oxidoreductase subunit L
VNETQLLRWIVLLPLLAAVYHGLAIGLWRRASDRRLVIALSCGSVIGSFVLSCWALGKLVQIPRGPTRFLVDEVYSWFGSGVGSTRFTAELGFSLDPLSAVMILVVTFVGSLIHIYSVGYMEDDHREDKGFQRFFCYLNLFMFAMLVLVLADNVVLMFLGWEGVGLCSYLLIGFWYADRHNAFCGSKAFIVNRVGDFAFLIGIFLLFAELARAGSPVTGFRDIAASFQAIQAATLAVPAWLPFGPEWPVVEVVAICFFLGACGKSAQIPLHVWLPDAMAGPTPVSALIHAATMVTAGVYMVCRLSFLYAAAPTASAIVAWTGGATALFAATIAIVQTDIKKVLAYSTVSQLGYMLVAAGCGGYSAAIFHLGTHAFFKALLFLAAGALILSMHHEQDLRRMGGLKRYLPRTRWVFLVGIAAIAGVPGFSGFFSKDEILVWSTRIAGGSWLHGIGLATAGLTAFYMVRMHCLAFHGECRAPASLREQIHEVGPVMLWPLYVLAVFSAFSGYAGLPQLWGDLLFGIEESDSLGRFLGPVLAPVEPPQLDHGAELGMALSAIAVAGTGATLAWWLYVRRPELPDRIAAALAGAYRTLVNKYWVDEIYDALLVRPLVVFSDRVLYRVVDAGIVDGVLVNGLARGVQGLASHGLKYAQSGLAQSYIFFMIVGAAALVGYLLR